MFLLFLWVTFIILVPKTSAYVASCVRPVNSLDVVNERAGAVWKEFDHKVAEFNNGHPTSGSSSFNEGGTKVFAAEKRKMTAYLERVKFSEPLRIKYADRADSVVQEYLRELERQSALANNLARISPSANYGNLVSALAKTDVQSHLAFIERARSYRRELISYLHSKKAFKSFLFITRQKEEEMFDGEEFHKWSRKYWDEWQKQFEAGKTIHEVWKEVWDSVEPLDLDDMPRFEFRELSIADSMDHALPDLVILIFLNLLFFLFAHVSFLRGGVKG